MSPRKRPLPSVADLLAEANRLFQYDRETGDLIRMAHADPWHPGLGKIGQAVGGDDGHGYRMCALFGHKFKVHQVVWLMAYGEMPRQQIDHANRNRRDNRIENLRLATVSQNVGNSTAALGAHPGAHRQHKGRRYYAKIDVNGKRHFLGNFDTKEEATAAYRAASSKMRGEFCPFNRAASPHPPSEDGSKPSTEV